jgi:lipoic acid synthetase
LADLRDQGVDFLTVGQYLQPDPDRYLPVVRYLQPEEFEALGAAARSLGFEQVASGPFVRSSYHARDMVLPAEPQSAATGRPSRDLSCPVS